MKLSAYIVAVDSGFAPNPFGSQCTLACCKPTIRRNAQIGDIVIGSGSARSGLSDRLVYAMRVKAVLPFQTYWRDYPSKRPSPRSAISRRGDNIWHMMAGQWTVVPSAFHNQSHQERDTRGENVLVSDEFYYFGGQAIAVPRRFKAMLATTQGHKNTDDVAQIDAFWKWLTRSVPRAGRIGQPLMFTEVGCRAQLIAR